MWTLVFINMILNHDVGYREPYVEAYYDFESIEECFVARETLLLDLGSTDGYPPINTQAVCIRTND